MTDLKNRNILLVDDDRYIRHSMMYGFKTLAKRFCTAKSAEEALVILEKERFDAIISDYRLPDMNGIDFFLCLGSAAPAQVRILISAYLDHDLLQKASQADIDAFIEKPFSRDAVAETLRRLMTAVPDDAPEKQPETSEERDRPQ